jgi:hypothetical protein
MATQDIMPFNSPHGGHDRIVTARLGALSTINTTNTSFREGEPLLLDVAAGDVNVIADGDSNVTTNHYIAAVSSQGVIETHNLTSGAATHDALVQMYPMTGADAPYFISQYVVTGAASDVLLTSAQKDAILVGDTLGIHRDNTATGITNNGENGRMSFDTNGTGLKLVRKLDANLRDTDGPLGGTCVWFVVTSNQA